jgi:hypothetical protein
VRDVYNEDWYLEVTSPLARKWTDGNNSFTYEDKGEKFSSPYGYAGITGDEMAARQALGRPLFIRYGIDQCAPGAIEWPTRVIPMKEPWFPGDTHLVEAARARRMGVTASYEGSSLESLRIFKAGYDEAMERKEAAEKYYDIAERLELWAGNPNVHVVLAKDAGAIFLTGDTWAHYHLSFRRPTAHNTAMHAIFDLAVPLVSGLGCQFMHLGGGTKPTKDDPLYKFKSRIGRLPWSAYFKEIP